MSLQTEDAEDLRSKAAANATQVALLRDELHNYTRQRWYSNHRSRWHKDPATTLHVDWSQLAGIVARSCTDMISEHMEATSSKIERMVDAMHFIQTICEKLRSSMGLSAYVAHTGESETDSVLWKAKCSSSYIWWSASL